MASSAEGALEIHVPHGAIRHAQAEAVPAHVAFTAAVAAIVVFAPAFEHARDHVIQLLPAKFLRNARLAELHPRRIEIANGLDRFADEGVLHGMTLPRPAPAVLGEV